MELRAYLSYNRRQESLCYWRSTSKLEVDFVVGRKLAVEVKATSLVTERDLKGLRALREENLINTLVVVSNDPIPRKIDDVWILPWKQFAQKLWLGELI